MVVFLHTFLFADMCLFLWKISEVLALSSVVGFMIGEKPVIDRSGSKKMRYLCYGPEPLLTTIMHHCLNFWLMIYIFVMIYYFMVFHGKNVGEFYRIP